MLFRFVCYTALLKPTKYFVNLQHKWCVQVIEYHQEKVSVDILQRWCWTIDGKLPGQGQSKAKRDGMKICFGQKTQDYFAFLSTRNNKNNPKSMITVSYYQSDKIDSSQKHNKPNRVKQNMSGDWGHLWGIFSIKFIFTDFWLFPLSLVLYFSPHIQQFNKHSSQLALASTRIIKIPQTSCPAMRTFVQSFDKLIWMQKVSKPLAYAKLVHSETNSI